MQRRVNQFGFVPESVASRSSLNPPKPPSRVSTSSTADDEPFLLTLEQVSRLVSISTRQIHRLKCLGQFPKEVRIGGCVRWRRCDVQQWVADGCPKFDNGR